MPAHSAGGDANRAQLTECVRDYLQRTGISAGVLARRCIDPETGQELLAQWVRHLSEGRVRPAPEVWRLRALAQGMQVDLEKLQRLAAAQWLGIELVKVGDGEWLTIEVPPGLTEAKRRIVIETAARLARELADE